MLLSPDIVCPTQTCFQANQINTLRTQVLELSSAVDVVTENGRMLQEEVRELVVPV